MLGRLVSKIPQLLANFMSEIGWLLSDAAQKVDMAGPIIAEFITHLGEVIAEDLPWLIKGFTDVLVAIGKAIANFDWINFLKNFADRFMRYLKDTFIEMGFMTYDIDNRLIGIRERTLIKENEKYGKYRPSILNKVMYNHPLSFVLYNLNNSKNNIKNFGRAVVFEGEKSTLLYASYFGMENDISVACCGSSLIQYQVDLLLGLGVEEIIVAFDKQFKKIGDKDWEKWTKKLRNIHQKYGKSCQISFMFDKGDLLNFKDSPIDQGPDVFIELFNRRVIL